MLDTSPAADTAATVHEIVLERVSIGARGSRYRLWHDGAALIESSRDPEFDACRALLARGIVGTLHTRHRGRQTVCLVLDIEKGAMARTNESERSGPRFGRWQPFDLPGSEQ